MAKNTVQELVLKQVAKAAGVSHQNIYYSDKGLRIGEYSGGYALQITWWDPQRNNADSLDLAVRMKVCVHTDVEVDGEPATSAHIFGMPFCTEKHFSNPLAATRLAIFRAVIEYLSKEEEGKND